MEKKEQIIKWLEDEKWYPLLPTNEEFAVSKLLNNILDDIISRLKHDN